jgi:4,5-dihydroxyphthalate decarboxylase
MTSGEVPLRRLFADPDAEELRYFKKYDFPIMHIVAIKRELAEREPALPHAVMGMFAKARTIAEDYFSDPNWSSLAFGRRYFEREKAMFGKDIWPSGLAANRANLERFMKYSRDQGLIRGDYPVEELFAASVRDT